MTTRHAWQLIIWGWLLIILQTNAQAVDISVNKSISPGPDKAAQRLYDQGQAAFDKENYPRALELFLDAYDHGMRTGQLYYNLGAVHFKLGSYFEAEAAYLRAARDPELTDISFYNLALVAVKQGDEKKTRMWLNRTIQTTYNPKIRQLAQTLLARLDETVSEAREQRAWSGVVSISAGYDDNVTLLSDAEAINSSGEDDSFIDVFGHAAVALFGSSFNLEVNGFVQRYEQLSTYDLDYGSLVISHAGDSRRWSQRSTLETAITLLDHNDFNRINTLSWTGRRRLSREQTLGLSYSIAQITSLDPAYDYLDGWRHRGKIEWLRAMGSGRAKLGYTLEYNDRKDLQNTYFTSYSSTGHTFTLDLSHPLTNNLSVDVEAEIRNSTYHDPNTYGGSVSITREETRSAATIDLNYELGKSNEVSLEIMTSKNVSNISTYGYKRTQVELSLLIPW